MKTYLFHKKLSRIFVFVIMIVLVNLVTIQILLNAREDRIPALVREFNPDTGEYLLPSVEFSRSYSILRDPVTYENKELLNPRINVNYLLYGFLQIIFRDIFFTNVIAILIFSIVTSLVFIKNLRRNYSFEYGIIFSGTFYLSYIFMSGEGISLIKKIISLVYPGINATKSIPQTLTVTPTRTLFYLIAFLFVFYLINYLQKNNSNKIALIFLGFGFGISFFVHFYLASFIGIILVSLMIIRRSFFYDGLRALLIAFPFGLIYLLFTYIVSKQPGIGEVMIRLGIFDVPRFFVPSIFSLLLGFFFSYIIMKSRRNIHVKQILILILISGILLDNLQLFLFPNPQPGNNFFNILQIILPFATILFIKDFLLKRLKNHSKIILGASIFIIFSLLFFQNYFIYHDRADQAYINMQTKGVLSFLREKTPENSVILSSNYLTYLSLVYSNNKAYIPLGFASLSTNSEILQRFVEGQLILGTNLTQMKAGIKDTNTKHYLFHLGRVFNDDILRSSIQFWGSMCISCNEKGTLDSSKRIDEIAESWKNRPSYKLDYIVTRNSDTKPLFVNYTEVYRNGEYAVYEVLD